MEELPKVTTYGKALKSERLRLELTQAKLAELTGTTQQNIQGIEAGRSIPGSDIHDKLVELFGRHTPLVNVARRGDIVMAADAIAKAAAMPAFSNKPQPISDAQVKRGWAEGAAQSAKEMEEAIGDALPQELRHNLHQRIDSGKRALRPDYMSGKLVVEWKYVSGNNLATAARLGMQQLCVFKAALEKHSTAPRRFMLALVIGQIESMRSNAMLTSSEEADMLGIEVIFCNDGGAVVRAIAQAEYNTSADEETDDELDFLYNAPPPQKSVI